MRNILPLIPIAAAYFGVPERLSRSARHIHQIFKLGGQFEELRKRGLPKMNQFV